MSPRVLFVSGLVAIAAALLWGAITYYTGYEIGYIAWLVGLIIGGAAVAVGGKGSACGVLCAALAVGSIFLGKVMAVQFSLRGQILQRLETGLTQDTYEEAARDAADFAELKSDGDFPAFMISHGFTESTTAQGIPAAELQAFKSDEAPRLREFHKAQPDYPTWRQQTLDHAADVIENRMPTARLVVQDLGPVDLLFGFLGIATAYRLPARRQTQPPSGSAA